MSRPRHRRTCDTGRRSLPARWREPLRLRPRLPAEHVQGARQQHQQLDRQMALPAPQALRHHPSQRGCRVRAGGLGQVQASARHGDESRHLVVVALGCRLRGQPRETPCAGFALRRCDRIDEQPDTFGQAGGDEPRPAAFFAELLGFAKQQDGERRLAPCRCDPGATMYAPSAPSMPPCEPLRSQPVANQAVGGVDVVLLIEHARAERRRQPGSRRSPARRTASTASRASLASRPALTRRSCSASTAASIDRCRMLESASRRWRGHG